MTDDLRTRIAAAVGDYHQRWGIKCECGADHAHAYGVADAVIRELDLAIPCAATGCRMRQIAKRHAENSSKLEFPDA